MSRVWKETLSPTYLHDTYGVYQGVWMPQMDNLRSHHVQGVQEAFEAAGIRFLYLPPYSPDLNPIEKMWSKLKAILRKWKVRSADLLPDSVAKALMLVSPSDCLHWFDSCLLC